MARRKSRRQRRQIYYRTVRSHREQPGYKELLDSYTMAKSELRKEVAKYQQQTFHDIRKLITNSFPSKVAHQIKQHSYSIFVLGGGSLCALWLILLFVGLKSWSTLFFLSATFLSLVLGANLAAAGVIRARRKKYSPEIKRLRESLRTFERNATEMVERRYEEKCADFPGYPPDWQSRRIMAFQRDGYTCQFCCRRLSASQLHAHHVLELSCGGTNRIENLMTLCPPCHREAHLSS